MYRHCERTTTENSDGDADEGGAHRPEKKKKLRLHVSRPTSLHNTSGHMVVLLVVHLPRRHPTVHLDVGPVPSARAAAAGEHLGSSVHVAASTLNVRSSFGHDAFLVLRASQVLVPLRPDGAVDVAGLCAVVASSGVAAQQEDQQAIEVDLVYGKPSTYAAQTQAAVRQLDGDVRGMRREVARLNDMLKAFQKQHLRQLEVIRTVLTQTGGGSGAGAGVDDSALQRAMRKAHFDGALSSGAPSTEPAPSTNGLRQGPERVPSPSSALFTPIGYLESVFLTKNGTPRQGFACAAARARLTVSLGANSEHYLDGLKDYSHVWLLFLFHDNGGGIGLRAKIQPPMRDGDKTGLFATRSPHRPNPIGLSLCRLDAIDGATLMLSAVDLIHGTPVLDIKPYLPRWDSVVPGNNLLK